MKKRKVYLIDRYFQFRIIAGFLYTILGALILFTTLTVAFYWASSSTGENLFKEYITIHRRVKEIREVIREGEVKVEEHMRTVDIPGVKRWELVVPPILINNLIIMIIISLFGIRFSHRIAGPLHRINTDIRRVIEGDKEVRIDLREKDMLQGLAEDINHLIDEVQRLRS
ncbi:MAG: hypothetical protein KAU17_00380 [Spirochaetales bacterium]|nr:hypothetical protein [Spirochaetales bacterium]